MILIFRWIENGFFPFSIRDRGTPYGDIEEYYYDLIPEDDEKEHFVEI